jgi:hypothetical protein
MQERSKESHNRKVGLHAVTSACSEQVLAGKMPYSELGVAHLQRGATAAPDPSLLWKLERLEHEVCKDSAAKIVKQHCALAQDYSFGARGSMSRALTRHCPT